MNNRETVILHTLTLYDAVAVPIALHILQGLEGRPDVLQVVLLAIAGVRLHSNSFDAHSIFDATDTA